MFESSPFLSWLLGLLFSKVITATFVAAGRALCWGYFRCCRCCRACPLLRSTPTAAVIELLFVAP